MVESTESSATEQTTAPPTPAAAAPVPSGPALTPKTPAELEAARASRYQEMRQRNLALARGESAKEEETAPAKGGSTEATDRSRTETTRTETQSAGTSPAAHDDASATSPEEKASSEPVEYQGLDRKTLQTMRQAKLLPKSPEKWNALDDEERREMLNAARERVAENTRKFQAEQKGREEPARTETQAKPPAPTAASTGSVDVPTPAAQQDVRKLVAPQLDAFKEEYGEKAANAFAQSLELIQAENARRLAEIDARTKSDAEKVNQSVEQLRKNEAARQAAEQQRQRDNFDRVAKDARKELSKDITPIIGTDDEAWNEIRQRAVAGCEMRQKLGQPLDDSMWKDELAHAAQGKFYRDIQLEAQRKLALSSKAAIKQTPSRPDASKTAPAKITKENLREVALAKAKAIQSGASAEEARKIHSAR